MSLQNNPVKLVIRHDTLTRFNTLNPLLLKGEVSIAFHETEDRFIMKVGDGVRSYVDLPSLSSDYDSAIIGQLTAAVELNTEGIADNKSRLDAIHFTNTFTGKEGETLITDAEGLLDSSLLPTYDATMLARRLRGNLIGSSVNIDTAYMTTNGLQYNVLLPYTATFNTNHLYRFIVGGAGAGGFSGSGGGCADTYLTGLDSGTMTFEYQVGAGGLLAENGGNSGIRIMNGNVELFATYGFGGQTRNITSQIVGGSTWGTKYADSFKNNVLYSCGADSLPSSSYLGSHGAYVEGSGRAYAGGIANVKQTDLSSWEHSTNRVFNFTEIAQNGTRGGAGAGGAGYEDNPSSNGGNGSILIVDLGEI